MNDRDAALRRMLACLGDSSRFRLVRTLVAGERCVTDLAFEVGLSQSCTTRHLQALQREGLVCGERSGKRVLYRLCSNAADVNVLLGWVAGTAETELRTPGEGRAFQNLSDSPDGPERPVKPIRDSGRELDESHEPGPEMEPTGLAYPRNDLEDYLL